MNIRLSCTTSQPKTFVVRDKPHVVATMSFWNYERVRIGYGRPGAIGLESLTATSANCTQDYSRLLMLCGFSPDILATCTKAWKQSVAGLGGHGSLYQCSARRNGPYTALQGQDVPMLRHLPQPLHSARSILRVRQEAQGAGCSVLRTWRLRRPGPRHQPTQLRVLVFARLAPLSDLIRRHVLEFLVDSISDFAEVLDVAEGPLVGGISHRRLPVALHASTLTAWSWTSADAASGS